MFDLIFNLIFTELPSPPLVDPRGLQRRPLPLEQLRAEGNCDLRAAAALNKLTRVSTIMHFSLRKCILRCENGLLYSSRFVRGKWILFEVLPKCCHSSEDSFGCIEYVWQSNIIL